MARKRMISIVLSSILCVLGITPALAGENTVYVIQLASILEFGVTPGAVMIPFDNRFTGIAQSDLNQPNNWAIEVNGNIIPNEPTRARVEALPNPRFIRLTVTDTSILAGGNLRLIYKGKIPNIAVTDIPKFSLIHVSFANDAPSDELLRDPKNWLIRRTHLQTTEIEQFPPDSVEVMSSSTLKNEASLKVNRDLDLSNYSITVRLQLPNFSEFTIGRPQRAKEQKAFTAAKGKADADIYFSGSAAGAKKSKPIYLFEAKLGYLFNLGGKGALGPRAEINAASESNIDPDSIKTALTYEKIFVLGRAKGVILRSDALGLEFDTKSRTRNFMTDLSGILVLPAKPLGESTFAAIDFMLGFEAGHNYRHKLNEDGLGNLWRWKFGANAYFVALNPWLLKRIDFATEYKLRLLETAEPFTVTIDDNKITTLEKKPRHYVGSNLDFMFSDALGISLKYQYGSLPPAFSFVNHAASVGLTFKLKQANK